MRGPRRKGQGARARAQDGSSAHRSSRRGTEATMGRSEGQIRVFLLDDHELVRQGLRTLLEADGDMVVVGEAATAAEALARIPAARPDVAVLDVRLPDGNGVEVCRE